MLVLVTTLTPMVHLVALPPESIFLSYNLRSYSPICYTALGMAVLRLLLLYILFSIVTPVAHADEEALWQEHVRLTFYNIRGTMRWGEYTHLGAAACGRYFPAGTQLRFVQDGWVVTCKDTGYLGYYQVDVWAPSYAWGIENIEKAYGTYAWVDVVRWGWGDE